MDLTDLDLAQHRIQILGKHRRERDWLTIPPATSAAISAWLTVRGPAPGPLFWALDRSAYGRRLTTDGIALIIHRLGARVGLPAHQARPHGLRHAAITAGLDRTGGDTRAVQAFARLADANTIRHYDDSRVDAGGIVAGTVADAVTEAPIAP
jgi:integrase/recombinase XerC